MCLASLIKPTWIYLLPYSARVPPPKGKSMSILFYIYRDPSKWNQWSSKSQIASTEFVGNLQHHNNIQSFSVHFFRNADQQVYVVIYFRESKNDKNFIWFDTTAVIVLIGFCFYLSSIIILCINYHVWLQHLWSVSSLVCHYQNLCSDTFTQ